MFLAVLSFPTKCFVFQHLFKRRESVLDIAMTEGERGGGSDFEKGEGGAGSGIARWSNGIVMCRSDETSVSFAVHRIDSPMEQRLVGGGDPDFFCAFDGGVEAAVAVIEADGGVGKETLHPVAEDEVFGDTCGEAAIGAEEPQAVGQDKCLLHIVGGEQDGLVLLRGQTVEERHGVEAAHDVEKGGGLVEDDEGTLLYQGFGYHGLLSFAVGKLGYERLRLVGDAHVVEGTADEGVVTVVETAEETRVGLAAEGDQLIDREASGLGLVCKHDADGARTVALTVVRERTAEEGDLSGKGCLGTGQGA